MHIFNQVSDVSSSQLNTIQLPLSLVNYVAANAGINALGVWVLLCSQTRSQDKSKQAICQQFNVSENELMAILLQLQELSLAWQENESGFDQDWTVSNLPKAVLVQVDELMANLNELSGQPISAPVSFESTVYESVVDIAPATIARWEQLELTKSLYEVATLKLSPELISKYWDTFITTNDARGEVVPTQEVLFKRWKAYVARVSVNMAVSDRRYQQNVSQRQSQQSMREQQNIENWQQMLSSPIPQFLSFTAAINNLSGVEEDVWRGFVQQNIRFKADPMNNTSLQYNFEEYCKTTGQKFLQKRSSNSEIDNKLDDTSWADKMDDVL